MSWPKHEIDGVVYDLSHLNSTLIRVKSSRPGAQVFTVRVTFGCHAFTKEVQPEDDPKLHYMDGGTTRCFCPIRYEHSLGLPALFRAAAKGGDTYFSTENNLLVLNDSFGSAGPYIAAYRIRPSNRPPADALIDVRSAYLKPTLAKELSTLPFYSVVAATSRGQKIVWGKRVAW
jgi:hypothetical protein